MKLLLTLIAALILSSCAHTSTVTRHAVDTTESMFTRDR